VDEEYEAKALIVPAEDKQVTGVSSFMKNLANLPIGLNRPGISTETDLYTTIITSRTTIESVIGKFDLLKEYQYESMEKAVKFLQEKIKTEVTDENAYRISVRAKTPSMAANIANYILELLNRSIIDLNKRKSTNNRLFLEKRYDEIKLNLRSAEDSLQDYQQRSGMIEAKEQTRLIMETLSKIEGDLITRQIQLSILENSMSNDSPVLMDLRMQLREYQRKLDEMKRRGGDDKFVLAFDALPEKAKTYIRLRRNVEIYSSILEFLVPLYEQARFDEQKDVPVLQVIDKGIPPEKKSYPPRTLFALMVTLGCSMLSFFYIILQENTEWKKSERISYIRKHLLEWKPKPD
jgi:capsule polysaccharide export protein KpsE/RkpR